MLGTIITIAKGVFDHLSGDDDDEKKQWEFENKKTAAKRHAFAYKRLSKTHGRAMKATRPTSKKRQQQRDYFAGVSDIGKEFDLFNEKKLAYLQNNIITDNDRYHASKGIDAYGSSLATSAIRSKFDIIDQPIDEEKSDISIKPSSIG